MHTAAEREPERDEGKGQRGEISSALQFHSLFKCIESRADPNSSQDWRVCRCHGNRCGENKSHYLNLMNFLWRWWMLHHIQKGSRRLTEKENQSCTGPVDQWISGPVDQWPAHLRAEMTTQTLTVSFTHRANSLYLRNVPPQPWTYAGLLRESRKVPTCDLAMRQQC